MSRGRSRAGASLPSAKWPSSGQRVRRMPIGWLALHVLVVISSSPMSSRCQRRTSNQTEPELGQESELELEEKVPLKEQPLDLSSSSPFSMSQIYPMLGPHQTSGALVNRQQATGFFTGREPSQIVYTDAQQRYLAHLARLQLQQQQLKQQLQRQLLRNNNRHSQSYPLNSFYSLDGGLDPDDLPATLVHGPKVSTPPTDQIAGAAQRNQNQQEGNVETGFHRPAEMQQFKGPSQQTPTKQQDLQQTNLITKQIQVPVRSSIQIDPIPISTSTSTTPAPKIDQVDEKNRFNQIVKEAQRHQPPRQNSHVAPINLATLIKPGEVLFSSKQIDNLEPHWPARERSESDVILGRSNLENILSDLVPLALNEDDKATGLRSAATLANDSPDALSAMEQDERDESQNQDDERDNERLLSHSTVFSNSNDQTRQLDDPNQHQADEDDDQTTANFLKALKTLSSQLSTREDEQQNQHLGSASTREEDFYKFRPVDRTEAKVAAKKRRPKVGVPIELLVDRLMAGSRLATRQGDPTSEAALWDHSNRYQQLTPADESNRDLHANDEQVPQLHVDDEDDEDDDEEDEESQQEMPEDLGETDNLAVNESDLVETRVELIGNNSDGASSSSEQRHLVTNSTNESWIPLKGPRGALPQPIALAGETWKLNSLSGGGAKSLQAANSKLIEKRRKRIEGERRRRSQSQEGTILIGKKRMTRLELVRLIRVLNKLANDKRASEQRETARKLLRHLIKVAVENYKQSQAGPKEVAEKVEEETKSNEHSDQESDSKGERKRLKSKDISGKRLVESLRSLLLEPTLGSSNTSADSRPKISIMMQPWRTKSALIQAERVDGEEDEIVKEPPSILDDDQQQQVVDGDLKRPKTLEDLSDNLENYFETDFFEDMADKALGNSSRKQIGSIESVAGAKQQTATTNVAPSGRILLDAKQADEADEEDVDLDHVRLRPRQLDPARSSGKPVGSDDDEDDQDSSERVGRKQRKRRRKKVSEPTKRVERILNKGDDGNQESDDEDDNDGHGYQRDREKPKRQPQESRKSRLVNRANEFSKKDKGSSRAEEKARLSRNKERKQDEEQEEGQEDETADRDEDDEEEGQRGNRTRDEDERDLKQPQDKLRAKQRRNGVSADENGGGQKRRWRKRPKRRLRAKQQQQRQKLKNRKERERDRGEIPAPIVSSVMSRGRIVGSAKQTSYSDSRDGKPKHTTKATVNTKQTAGDGNKNPKTANPNKNSEPKSRPKASKNGAHKKVKEKQKSAPVKGMGPVNAEVVSYFNEGEEICEDGKCRRAMKSSHPKVVAQLKSKQDKRDLGQQIGKWLQVDETETKKS